VARDGRGTRDRTADLIFPDPSPVELVARVRGRWLQSVSAPEGAASVARAEPLQVLPLVIVEALRTVLVDLSHDPVELLEVHGV
jgi:hypothetical protein